MTEELNTTEQATPSSGTRIARATGAIMAFQLLSFIFAYLTKRVVAHYFGTGDEADAYMIAFSIPYVYLFLVGEELLTHSFLPPFVERMRKVSEREAWKLASILGNLQAIILVVAIGIGIAVSPWLVKIFAPGFQGAKAALTVDLTRVISRPLFSWAFPPSPMSSSTPTKSSPCLLPAGWRFGWGLSPAPSCSAGDAIPAGNMA